MRIKDLITENRPIEKMLKNGTSSLTNEELLAILINVGTKNKSAIELAGEILNDLSTLSDLLDYDIYHLMKYEGVKEVKGARIEAAIELTRRMLFKKEERKSFINPRDAINFMYPLIKNGKKERLIVMYLDANCRLIKHEIFDGEAGSVTLPYNDIIKKCLDYNSRGIILAHNHPSGNPTPSKADIDITQELGRKLEYFELYLFDHMILGDGKYYSFEAEDEFKFKIKER